MRGPFDIVRDVVAQYDDEFGKGAWLHDLVPRALLAVILLADAYAIASIVPAFIEAAGQ